MSVRVRFAPSPTGPLHLGNARTALFNWLFTRKHGGKFVLRIEDTDRERSKPEFEARLMEDLRWLGLDWDEGPEVGGPVAPYRQSERLGRYQEAAQELLSLGRAYYCFCSEEELESERQAQLASGVAPRYSGRCKNLPPAEVERRRASGEPAAVRFSMPPGMIVVEDLVKGTVKFSGLDIGDFICLRSDGTPSYNFAAAVDDSAMKITHVIRGDDHLANSPRQIAVYQVFGWTVPTFAHLPLIIGEDGTPLSKRHGDFSVGAVRAMGYLPEAVVNYLGLLGWSPPKGVEELMTLEGLTKHFSFERVSQSPARFDQGRMAWFNTQHLRRASAERLVRLLGVAADPSTLRLVEVIRRDARTLSEVQTILDDILHFTGVKMDAQNRSLLAAVRTAVEDEFGSEEEVQAMLDRIAQESGASKRMLMQTVRLALTGEPHGLPVTSLLWALGSKESRRRLDHILEATR